MLEDRLSRVPEEWLATNRPLRHRFPNEPTTNIDGLEIPDWINRDVVFKNLRTHYDDQHAALTPADIARPFSRQPSQVLGADPTKPVIANYFVIHDTDGTVEPLDGAAHHRGTHMWIGTIALARGQDWHEAGDGTKLEGRSSRCFVHVELVRATKGAINNASPTNYPNPG